MGISYLLIYLRYKYISDTDIRSKISRISLLYSTLIDLPLWKKPLLIFIYPSIMYSVIDVGLQLKENSPFPDDISKCNNLIFIYPLPTIWFAYFQYKNKIRRLSIKKLFIHQYYWEEENSKIILLKNISIEPWDDAAWYFCAAPPALCLSCASR